MNMLRARTKKTDPDLLSKLEVLAKRGLTQEERDAQRVSFIYSGMSDGSRISKAEIERILKAS